MVETTACSTTRSARGSRDEPNVAVPTPADVLHLATQGAARVLQKADTMARSTWGKKRTWLWSIFQRSRLIAGMPGHGRTLVPKTC